MTNREIVINIHEDAKKKPTPTESEFDRIQKNTYLLDSHIQEQLVINCVSQQRELFELLLDFMETSKKINRFYTRNDLWEDFLKV